jgi:hypothetical protein
MVKCVCSVAAGTYQQHLPWAATRCCREVQTLVFGVFRYRTTSTPGGSPASHPIVSGGHAIARVGLRGWRIGIAASLRFRPRAQTGSGAHGWPPLMEPAPQRDFSPTPQRLSPTNFYKINPARSSSEVLLPPPSHGPVCGRRVRGLILVASRLRDPLPSLGNAVEHDALRFVDCYPRHSAALFRFRQCLLPGQSFRKFLCHDTYIHRQRPPGLLAGAMAAPSISLL